MKNESRAFYIFGMVREFLKHPNGSLINSNDYLFSKTLTQDLLNQVSDFLDQELNQPNEK